jgi:Ca2+-binding EF-hand superfamily protein
MEERRIAKEKREAEIKAEREKRAAEAQAAKEKREAEEEIARQEYEAKVAKEIEARRIAKEKRDAEIEKEMEERRIAQEKREIELKLEMEEREAKMKVEEAARIEALKAEQIENAMFVRYLKQVMTVERQNESLREMLFSHKTFNVQEAFALLDADCSGDIDAAEMVSSFVKAECPMDLGLAEKIVALLDSDEKNTIDMKEFGKAVTPLKSEYRHPACVGTLTFEQQYLYK